MDHPQYSPDLAPADFWLFSQLKSMLKGKYYLDVEDIKPMKTFLTDIPAQDFSNCMAQAQGALQRIGWRLL